MDMFDLAGTLFGNRANPVAQGPSITATGSTASADGVAGVTFDGDVTPAEDVGEDVDQTVIDLPTSPDVAEGDEVIVTLVGDGPLKTPIVIANPGSGDRMAALANSAKTIADAAQAVAEATGQHFWPDTDGVHVTEVTQEAWSDSTSSDYHSGANVLLNALGQLFRDGLNNLLALVGGTNPGVAIYDGAGNDAENIVASFDGDGVTLGANSTSATIDMCAGAWRFSVDTSDTSNETATIWLNQEAVDEHTANAPTLRIMSGTDTLGRGIVIRGTSGAQYPVNVVSYQNGNITDEVGMGSLGVMASGLYLTNGSGSIVHSPAGFYEKTNVGQNFWSTPPGTVLWSGGWHMVATQTANLSHNISTCPSGVVLHFQPYTSSTVQNYNHIYYFVPKSHVASYNGTGVVVLLGNPDFSNMASKYLYISNDHITGHANNTATGTNSGITYNRGAWVMTQVIAV